MDQNTEKQPVFSIITVTFNHFEGLKKTYKSITNQSLKSHEWIVIDGNSSDETKKWLKTAKAHWVSEPDKGLYDAMNKGIERATGQYLLFLNSGDTLADAQNLEQIRRTIENSKPDFIYGDAYEGDFLKRTKPHTKIARGMFTHHQAMLYKRSAIGKLRYDLKYKIAADYDFTARFLKNTKHALYCEIPICIFEIGGLSQTNANQARKEEARIRSALGLGSPLFNMITTVRQIIAQIIKTKTPWLYRIMR